MVMIRAAVCIHGRGVCCRVGSMWHGHSRDSGCPGRDPMRRMIRVHHGWTRMNADVPCRTAILAVIQILFTGVASAVAAAPVLQGSVLSTGWKPVLQGILSAGLESRGGRCVRKTRDI